MFLSSTIFEERHLIVVQLISYLFPEVAFKKISGFRPGLSSRAWGFVCRKLIRECAGKNTWEGWGKENGGEGGVELQ